MTGLAALDMDSRLDSRRAKIPRQFFIYAERAAEKVFFVIPSEARDLLFFAKPKKKQIPRANPDIRNDPLRVFPQPQKPVQLLRMILLKSNSRQPFSDLPTGSGNDLLPSVSP
jgi:hypothetical protein